MKAASTSEWYKPAPRQVLSHQQLHTSPSSLLSNFNQHHHRESFHREYKSHALSVTSSAECSFSSCTNTISDDDSNQTYYRQYRQYPQRQVSKVLTPTITSTSSTSFSKSYSGTSRSLSNTTECSVISEETSDNTQPHYSFPSCAGKTNGRDVLLAQQPNILTSSERSDVELTRNTNSVPLTYTTAFSPVILETETSEETDAAFTESEGEDDPYGTVELPSDDEEQVYQSFKQSVKMLGDHSQNLHESFEFQSKSPTVSIQSVLTELEEDMEELLTDSIDDEEVSCTEEEEELESTYNNSSYSSSDDNTIVRDFHRSRGVPNTPVTIRVKVEKTVPQTYDDRVKVTVQVEEEESDDGDERSSSSEDNEMKQNGDENSTTEQNGATTDSDATFTDSAVTVKYQTRRGGESSKESSYDGSENEISSDETDDEMVVKTPLFPSIPGVTAYKKEFLKGNNVMSCTIKSDSFVNVATHRNVNNVIRDISGTTSNIDRWLQEVETSVDSSRTVISESTSSEQTNVLSSASDSTTNATTSSNTDLSLRSQSARSSLTGRASAIHKMYSVGGKLRSLSARRSTLNPRLQSPSCTLPRLQLSTDSNSPSTINSKDTESTTSSEPIMSTKKKSHSNQISTLTLPTTLPHSRSLSASLSRHQFSAALRQLSLGNIQAMNPPFPKSAAKSLAEKVFKGESLPPIVPLTRPSTSASTIKPPSLTRNLTYTVCTNVLGDDDESTNMNALPTLPPAQSTEHITLRQLILSDRTSSSSSSTDAQRKSNSQQDESPDELLFPLNLVSKGVKDLTAYSLIGKPPAQVSFASTVIEHSLSSTHSELIELPKQTDPASEESSSDSYFTCRLTGRRLKRLTNEEEDELLNKDYLTFQELQEEYVNETDTSNEKLQHFALDAIRKQMEMERRRIESLTEQDDEIFSNFGFSNDENESESSEDSSEEEEDEKEYYVSKPWKDKDTSHIPMATHEKPLPEVKSGEEKPELKPDTETAGKNMPEDKLQKNPSSDVLLSTNGVEEGTAISPEETMSKSLDNKYNGNELDSKDDDALSLLPTRINSAESGYRAMPPSRAESTRENSMDPEEMEREKERLMQEWKDSNGGPPKITTSVNSTSSHMILGGELITINYSRPNTASDTNGRDARIQNGIDLTQELPGEEKKIAAVWEEFNRDEREGGAMADYEFSTLLDEMIMDVNSYKPQLSTTGLVSNSNSSQSQSLQVSAQATSSSWEQPKFDPSRKYTTLSELVSLLSHNLRLVSSETLEDHMASLISLISSVLRKVRKNRTDDDYVTQIACLSAIRVLCDRLQEMTSSQNLKYADLSWLFRVLCKYSSDSDSKIRPEASFCLARLVKVAGPALVVRPIYFILVMESEGGTGKSTTGAKTKAAAIDTLTYAMLTFPKEDFHNLEEIAGWVCLAMLNEERRIRQSALECLSIISQHLGGRDKALPLFHTLFLKEELDHFSRSPSPESYKTSKTGKSSKRNGKGSDPIPLSVHGTVRLLTGPGFPIAQPIDAITARLDKDVLPVPSTKGLIEYAVNVPTGKDLVLLMTHMLDKDDDEWDFSSSTDSLDSGSAHSKRSSVTSLGFSDIDWTGEGPDKSKNKEDGDLISPDVAYILLGKGRVNKSDVVLLDTYKKEIIPEIIQMLNEKNKQGKERRSRNKWWKNQKNKKRRRKTRKNAQTTGDGKLIPTISFDDDDTFPSHKDKRAHDINDELEEEVFDDPNSPVAVVVNPPQDEENRE